MRIEHMTPEEIAAKKEHLDRVAENDKKAEKTERERIEFNDGSEPNEWLDEQDVIYTEREAEQARGEDKE